ncbi:hypothetical protein JAAARDRAFT_27780 [Jaapia argillacea MUCL 33604]|uniref:F-box domain-containing protein n=1 Tax=Jaapia argillacea MUCL 33604 TaxID=933084 RepID=A0A067QB18_9AGAM|nr:hypothetical protein JAAARDRAFT_27780 [Jaapia argillacea MUCL 33604]
MASTRPNTLRDLTTVVLVSREWNLCGTALLYRNPFIDSPKSLYLFMRTVTTDALLGSFVRSIVVWNMPLTPPRVRPFAVKKRRYRRAQQNWTNAMRACPHVTALGIVCNSSPNFHPSIATCLPDLKLFTPLRQLRICGRKTWFRSPFFIPPDIVFPVLEELSLECFILDNLIEWPRLPALKRLRLSCCHVFQQGSLIPKGLPSLRWVELVGVGTHMRADNQIEALYGYANVLESLAITVACWTSTHAVLEVSRFKALKHLALDFQAFFVPPPIAIGASVQPGLTLDRLPPKLKTLDFLDLTGTLRALNNAHIRQNWHDTSAVQGDIRDAMIRVLSGGRDSVPSLRGLYVEGMGTVWTQWREELSLSCNALDVKFESLFYGAPVVGVLSVNSSSPLLVGDEPRVYKDTKELGKMRARNIGWPSLLLLGMICVPGDATASLSFVDAC